MSDTHDTHTHNDLEPNFFRVLFPTCTQATQSISIAKEKPLPTAQNLGIKMHIMMCSGCRAFYKNTDTISEMIQAHKNQEAEQLTPSVKDNE